MSLRRRLRRLWLTALIPVIWANRRDLQRWVRFGLRALRERETRPLDDLVMEAKVRAAVTADPFLRRDEALEDVRVEDGVVMLLTRTAGWPDPRDQMARLKRIEGVTDVTSHHVPTMARG